jgi:membrane-associated protease RseP (regulator of RpoE activity)
VETPPRLPNLPPPPPAGPVPQRPRLRWRLSAALLAATFLSALAAGALAELDAAALSEKLDWLWAEPARLLDGLPFALALLGILLAHELGHFFTARRFGVEQSLPYFIPAPTLFGTLGAVILMRSQPQDRRVLLYVAVMGPFVGLLAAVPVTAWGLMHSVPVAPGDAPASDLVLGSSLLFRFLVAELGPGTPFVDLHPVAVAGWVGLFVTCLNLIPAAQLDGGHVAYALFGPRQERLSSMVLVALFTLGATLGLCHGGALQGAVWVIWAAFLYILGVRHPPVRDESVPLLRRHRAMGIAAFALFVVTFTPVPVASIDDLAGGAPPALESPGDAPRPPGAGEEYRL